MLSLLLNRKIVLTSLTVAAMSLGTSCRTTGESEVLGLGGGGGGGGSYTPPSQPYTPPKPTCQASRSLRSQAKFAYERSDAADAERVRCLARAVKGIGTSTAQKLVENNELRHFPSSWEQFKSHMESLENKGYDGIRRNTITGGNGSQNKQNLYPSQQTTPAPIFNPTPRPQPRPQMKKCDTSRTKQSQLRFAYTPDSRSPDAERAKCLASAVRGIGNSTATKLIANGEMRRMPSSWNQFKDHMQSLQNKGTYGKIRDETVARYGSDNSKLFK